MKHQLIRALAVILALLLALSSLALAEGTDGSTVLFTYDGEEFTQAQVKDTLDSLIANEYLTDENDYEAAIEYMIQNRLIDAKIKELGLDQFTEEEEAAFRTEAADQMEEGIELYVSYFLSEDTEEARAKAREDAINYFAAYGYTEEAVLEQLKQSAAYDKLEQTLLEGKDVAVTEDEIREVFEYYAEQDKALYEGNVYLYEMYQSYYGAESWYQPEGYRGIIHILLSVDDELLDAWENAEALYEESVTDENPEGDAALQAAVEEARQAALESKRDVIDDIYARLEKGESFESLIAEYGEDPGMQNEAYLREGYAVHPDSITWIDAFTTGAFSEKMQKPGDVSDPVLGSYGIHILYYLRDIPGGYIEMSDEISSQIEDYLYSQKTNKIYTEALDQWALEHEIVYNQDAIDALTGEVPAA